LIGYYSNHQLQICTRPCVSLANSCNLPNLCYNFDIQSAGLAAILTSIIIPILNKSDYSANALECLTEQAGNFESIVVCGSQTDSFLTLLPRQATVISGEGATRGALLNAGAAAARGDVLLFLWPTSRLPANAIQAIERNLTLLPQTIGGNFHVKFNSASLFSRALTYFLRKWRYQGHYYGNSGIFIRVDIFRTISGFKSFSPLEDYDFVRRMEKYGPTLYLPDTISVPVDNFRHSRLKAALVWVAAHLLFWVGLHPQFLARQMNGPAQKQ